MCKAGSAFRRGASCERFGGGVVAWGDGDMGVARKGMARTRCSDDDVGRRGEAGYIRSGGSGDVSELRCEAVGGTSEARTGTATDGTCSWEGLCVCVAGFCDLAPRWEGVRMRKAMPVRRRWCLLGGASGGTVFAPLGKRIRGAVSFGKGFRGVRTGMAVRVGCVAGLRARFGAFSVSAVLFVGAERGPERSQPEPGAFVWSSRIVDAG